MIFRARVVTFFTDVIRLIVYSFYSVPKLLVSCSKRKNTQLAKLQHIEQIKNFMGLKVLDISTYLKGTRIENENVTKRRRRRRTTTMTTLSPLVVPTGIQTSKCKKLRHQIS